MRRPICVDCQIEMVPLKNSFVIETMDITLGGFQKFEGDKYGCPNCSFEIVAGIAAAPCAVKEIGAVGTPYGDQMTKKYNSFHTDLEYWSSLEEKRAYEVNQ